METDHDLLTPAEQAFADFLEEQESGSISFDEFCAAHPELEAELRRIHEAWSWADELLEPSSAEPAVGDLGEDSRYESQGEVARGGMGVVVRVFDRTLRRTVAMKVLPESHGRDPLRTSRFVEEAQVTGQLEHPAIVPIYDRGRLPDGRLFYTMPLVQGRELAHLFQLAREGRDGWTQARAVGVLLRVCEALSAAHERGVVHRDLKPSNVMVGAHGEVYVMDWGLALVGSPVDEAAVDRPASDVRSERSERLRDDPSSGLGTLDGQVLGTPSYMSPEQARDADVDPRSDVYSVGAMLRQLLTGARPYAEDGSSPDSARVLESLRAGPPPSLARVSPQAAPELAAIADRAMERRPDARYPDMAALADDLRAFLESRVVTAHRTGLVASFTKWVRRNPALFAATVLAFGSITAGLVVSLAQKHRADDEARRAEEQAERAEGEAHRAEENLSAALAAVDRMLTEVGAEDLDDVPGLQPVRRRLLAEARDFYEGFLEQRDDAELQERVARAHLRLAAVYALLGDAAEAAAGYDASIAAYEELARRGEIPDAELHIVGVLEEKADFQREQLDWEASRATLTEALERLDRLVVERPDDPQVRFLQVRVYDVLGAGLVDRRDPEAERWLTEAIEIGGELVREGFRQAETELAHGLNLLGVLLNGTGRAELAREPLERSIALREVVLEREPGRGMRFGLLSSLGNLCVAVGISGTDPDEPERISERMVVLARELRRDFPAVPGYAVALAKALTTHALPKVERGQFDAGLELLREAQDELLGTLAAGADPSADAFFESMRFSYAWAHFAAGRHRELADDADRLPQLVSEDVRLRVRCEAYLFCLLGLLRDEELPVRDLAALEERYVENLEGLFGALGRAGRLQPLLRGPAFESLRDYPLVADALNGSFDR